MKICILEDEKTLAISMQEFLEDSGYEVEYYTNSEEAFDNIYENSYDLLLLDVNVNGEQNGFELLAQLRESSIKTPAIFITSLNNIEDLTLGYSCGCCDYIRKPFDLAELKLRVNFVIRQHCFSSVDAVIDLGEEYHYNTESMQLFYKNQKISLSKTEMKILELLIKHRGSPVTQEMFCEEVWGEYVDSANIRVQVGTLRKKLKKDFIKNLRGVGYTIEV